jgi:hypothetical protein
MHLRQWSKVLGGGLLALVAACADGKNGPSAPRETDDGLGEVSSVPVSATASLVGGTVVVLPTSTDWGLFPEGPASGTGNYVAGPSTTPAGTGSVRLTLSGTAQGYVLGARLLGGQRLDGITSLGYSTYRSSDDPGNNLAVALQFEVDFDDQDAYVGFDGRLVFEPYHRGGSGSVVANQWQRWDPIDDATGGWFTSRANVTSGDVPAASQCPQSDPCSWSEVLTHYPDIAVRPLGGVFLKAGSGWTSFDGNVDALTIGIGGVETTFDFEPSNWGACQVEISGTTYRLLDDCITDQTLLIPDGFTLDGDGHTITAIDPAGGHFIGAIVRNEGSTAHVTDVTVTASALADVCDAGASRLRGIMLEGASGSVTNTTVTGVRQGQSGCQEGNAIEVRNFEADGATPASPRASVTISGNTVTDYMKNGITANGGIAATITGNTVAGDGPISFIAQNGIQVGFGATASVQGNAVSGNDYTPTDWLACGLLFFEASGVKAAKNSYSGNEKDLCNFGGRGGGTFNAAP